jgi:hypothetical protein
MRYPNFSPELLITRREIYLPKFSAFLAAHGRKPSCHEYRDVFGASWDTVSRAFGGIRNLTVQFNVVGKRVRPSVERAKKPRRKAVTLICLDCRKPIQGKFRCAACRRLKENADHEGRWLRGEIPGHSTDGGVRPFVRRWVFSKFGSKCAKCGWCEVNPKTGKIPLCVEHVDGNWENTVPDNLTLLCPNHHALTPTYGSLNKGRGRPWRGLLRNKARDEI